MRIEPKQAFYNEDTGAVQPWKDIEVTDTVGSALVAEGLVTEIEGGGGGGDFSTAQVTFINSASGKTYAVTPVWPTIGEDEFEYMGGMDTTVVSSSHMFEIPLYKDKALIVFGSWLINTDEEVMPTTTGGVALEGSDSILITGDGTITFSGTGSAE